MQIESFARLSLFRIFRYTADAGAAFDYLKSPRPFFFLAAMLKGEAVFEDHLGMSHHIKEGDLLFIPQGAKYRSFWPDPDRLWSDRKSLRPQHGRGPPQRCPTRAGNGFHGADIPPADGVAPDSGRRPFPASCSRSHLPGFPPADFSGRRAQGTCFHARRRRRGGGRCG